MGCISLSDGMVDISVVVWKDQYAVLCIYTELCSRFSLQQLSTMVGTRQAKKLMLSQSYVEIGGRLILSIF